MELPRVTFIIAHHNYQEFLGNAIQSALNQTYPNIHICVIDDCSNDIESVNDIIAKFEQSESFSMDRNLVIRSSDKITCIYITDQPYGPSYARNRGIEYLWDETDIFAILDADDENYPEKIEKCVNKILENPNQIGIVYADHVTLNTTTGRECIEYREPYDIFRLNQECIIHSGSVINKIVLSQVKDENGFYDETMRTCEDYDLWMRITEKFMVIHLPEPLSLVRVQPKNSSDTVKQEIWNRNYRRVFEKKQQRCQQ